MVHREEAASPAMESLAEFLHLYEFAATMSPEEYVARHAHEYVLAGPLAYRYADPAFDAWIGAVLDLMHNHPEVVRLRQQYLTPGEIEAAEAAEGNL